MTYNDIGVALDGAWSSFFDTLSYQLQIDTEVLAQRMDNKDCFNDVIGCVMSCVDLDSEDEDE